MKKYWLPLAALPAILLLSIVRQIPFPDFPASRISATQTAPALPVSANSTSPESPSSPETVLAPLFPDAEILASREIPFSENRLQRLRLLRVPSEHSPIRVEEIWTIENSAASSRL